MEVNPPIIIASRRLRGLGLLKHQRNFKKRFSRRAHLGTSYFVYTPIAPHTDRWILQLSNLQRGGYRYTDNLLALEQASPIQSTLPYKELTHSSLHLPAWERLP